MANVITGTIAGTGATASVVGYKFLITMNFTGTASIDVEMRAPDGNWIKLDGDGTAIVADYCRVAEFPVAAELRLNCTAFTESVAYSLAAGG